VNRDVRRGSARRRDHMEVEGAGERVLEEVGRFWPAASASILSKQPVGQRPMRVHQRQQFFVPPLLPCIEPILLRPLTKVARSLTPVIEGTELLLSYDVYSQCRLVMT